MQFNAYFSCFFLISDYYPTGADIGFLVGGEASPYFFFNFCDKPCKINFQGKLILLKPFEYIEMIK